MDRLVTLKEYIDLPPCDQGYQVGLNGGNPNSELRSLTNPYPPKSLNGRAWDRGYQLALANQNKQLPLWGVYGTA